MIGLDTNVLVRYLVEDDPSQAERARTAIEEAMGEGTPLFVSAAVLCELVWVLDRAYHRSRGDIAAALDALLRAAHLRFEHPSRCRRALDAYRAGRGDFADYLLGLDGEDAGCRHTLTFDGDLDDSPHFAVM